MSRIFISHVERDAAIMQQIADGLEAAGYSAWYFERDVLPGTSYLIQITQAIEQCDALVLVISPNALGSDQVTKEVVGAFEMRKPFFPVLVDITPPQLKKQQEEWRHALGGTAMITVGPEGLHPVIARIIDGLKAQAIQCGGGKAAPVVHGSVLTTPKTHIPKPIADKMSTLNTKIERQIRFCTRSDGVRLAYLTMGNGPALVSPPRWTGHLELMWVPVAEYFFERLARHHTVVLYDKHGTGLSDRDRTDFTMEAELKDLEAVVDHLKLEQLALFGDSEGGPIAACYADKYPQRVTHLVLCSSFARGKVIGSEDLIESLISLVRAHWGIGSKTLTDMFIPGADANVSQAYAYFQRESATPEMAAKLLELCYHVDITDLVHRLQVPTLVLHREQDQSVPFHLGRELAALIPNARFVPLKGDQHVPWFGDCDSVLRAIADFLGDPVPESTGQAPLTILFTDMKGSTTLTQQLGDNKAQEILRNHNTIIRNAINTQGGKEIKHTGDGVMVSFPSASLAILCAIIIQMGLDQYNQANPNYPIRVRIGLNTGEAISEDQDLFGTAIQLGARICAYAKSGQILVSDVVRQLVAGKDFQFIDRGETMLQGFKQPVRLYEVPWK